MSGYNNYDKALWKTGHIRVDVV